MDARAQDRALLARCLAHDRDAWTELVARFSRLIYGVIHATLRRHGVERSGDLADELFHQTFVALYERNYRKLRQWSGRCSLASWIRLITSSIVLDELRRQRPMEPLEGEDGRPMTVAALVDDRRVAEATLVEIEEALEVRAALSTLSASDRELLLMLFRDELKPGDAAAALGVRPSVLYTRKNRALGRLREAVLARRAARDDGS